MATFNQDNQNVEVQINCEDKLSNGRRTSLEIAIMVLNDHDMYEEAEKLQARAEKE